LTNLAGLERWGYVTVAPDPADAWPKPPRSDWVVRPTPAGRRAQNVWRPLGGVIEQRWQARFGEPEIDELRGSLDALVNQLDVELPHYLPVVSHGKSEVPELPVTHDAAPLGLSVLVSQALLAFTLDFESESDLPLPIAANVLRVLDEDGVRIRDLPRLTGVSKEATSMSLGFLERKGHLVIDLDPAATQVKVARLTPNGRNAQDAYRQLLGRIEERWHATYGDAEVRRLRRSLEGLVGDRSRSPLSGGLKPYPDGWRASVRTPDTLPHYPMVLHRGGFPDGA
jgi:DNA-binding MarR family transcriptional regulator